MFGFGKKQDNTPKTPEQAQTPASTAPDGAPEDEGQQKAGLFARLKQGLSKTRSGLGDAVANLVLGEKEIDDELLEDLETQLLTADVGIDATRQIIDDLTARVARKQLKDGDALLAALREDLAALLTPCSQPLQIPSTGGPFVILMIGVNGVGKTTTIGKLARRFQQQGHSVMLAAGDTFRAAAVEQLQVWGERNNIPVVAQHTGADSASVIFDALQSAQSKNIDILIADTAGRLHTKDNLMEELVKIKRVLGKLDINAPHETMIVLDATTGQNALVQTEQFHAAIGLTGITLTKLDGTAKGGIIFSIANKTKLPIRYIGVGEGIEDLRPFDADEFSRALFE
ncbi:signal recognition particle-docking protein FtsY [Sulfuriflexus mobilis]|uniref:signal recognition particle-docking protein FtsY n=1 Tax=Sulfuriflexus mobilis TaxID=1811807 RepID=UPI000F83377A|nr:signal recognition particle-docking protein FtsY [Sulfuriflexus mobilis]